MIVDIALPSVEIPALSQQGAVIKSHEQALVMRWVIKTNPFGRAMEKCSLHGAVEVGFEAVYGDLEATRLVGRLGSFFIH